VRRERTFIKPELGKTVQNRTPFQWTFLRDVNLFEQGKTHKILGHRGRRGGREKREEREGVELRSVKKEKEKIRGK